MSKDKRSQTVTEQTTFHRREDTILSILSKEYPDATIALEYDNPLELLISTILSAQCTDARVNIVTKILFKKYRSARDYATVNQAELENDIHSTGFFRAKARNIIACCTILVEQYNGEVPSTMEELIRLPGVGRKTANVVLAGAYGNVEGVVVDTHVGRLSNRLGFSVQSNPEKIEHDLMKLFSRKEWFLISNVLILHGRNICDARKPKCSECSLNRFCPSVRLP